MKNLFLLVAIAFALASLALAQETSMQAQQKPPTIDFAKKIADATPTELPQSPEGLKGKVKRVIEYSQTADSRRREVDSENFYDENGNLTKTVHYDDEGYPQSVVAWG